MAPSFYFPCKFPSLLMTMQVSTIERHHVRFPSPGLPGARRIHSWRFSLGVLPWRGFVYGFVNTLILHCFFWSAWGSGSAAYYSTAWFFRPQFWVLLPPLLACVVLGSGSWSG